jgi:hypothetical protein
MTQQEILEGNKLIAEFMGLSLGSGRYKYPIGYGSSIIDLSKISFFMGLVNARCREDKQP